MKIRTWHAIGFVFTLVLAILLHFAYEWSGFSPVFAVFGSVNESTWEHLKLLYWPYAIFTIWELWIYGKDTCGFFTAKILGVLAGMFFITAALYTYTGIIGSNYFWADMLIFILGVAVSYRVSYNKIKSPPPFARKFDFVSFIIFLALACMFCIFTFDAPNLGIFTVSML